MIDQYQNNLNRISIPNNSLKTKVGRTDPNQITQYDSKSQSEFYTHQCTMKRHEKDVEEWYDNPIKPNQDNEDRKGLIAET